MKDLSSLVLILSIICITANVSHSAKYWAKTYGGSGDDRVNSIQQTSDGGYIVAGRTRSFGAGNRDMWIIKLDSGGNVTWQKTYGGSDHDEAYSIQQTTDGGFIVAGHTFFMFGEVYGNNPFWILKLDSDGDVLWQRVYGWGERGSSHKPYDIQQTTDGGYIVAGESEELFNRLLVLKLDSNGNIIWEKTFGGGEWGFQARSIQQTSDEGYIVAGTYIDFLGGNNSAEMWIIKLDNNGDVSWQRTYGENYIAEEAYSIQQTLDGGYIVAGQTDIFRIGLYVWVLKLDSFGNITWQKRYEGSDYDIARSIQQTSDGGYIILGSILIKTDTDGNVQWGKNIKGNYVQQSVDGGYIVASNTSSFVGGYSDLLVLKLNSDGEIPDCDIIETINVTASNTYVSGKDQGFETSVSCLNYNTNILPLNSYADITTVCSTDFDEDGVLNADDNCPYHHNPDQLDTYPPQGNDIGDACDCESDFSCDENVDADDVMLFLIDFGRGEHNNYCTNLDPCHGDFNCDTNVDAADVTKFLEDFGRSEFFNPCPPCEVGNWCVYP